MLVSSHVFALAHAARTLSALPSPPPRSRSAQEPGESFEYQSLQAHPGNGRLPDHYKYFTSGNKVTPLADARVTPDDKSDDIFAQIHQAIDGATESIRLEMFGLGQSSIVEKLVAKQQSGVTVQVVLDPVNDDYEAEKQECADALRQGGVEVLFYPVQPAGGKQKYPQINHVKMLIVDGDEAIIGGMNWGRHSPLNHDMSVRVEGPAVDAMERLFNKDYLLSQGARPLPVERTPAHPQGTSLVSLLAGSKSEVQIQAALRRAIRGAKSSIQAELFFLTHGGLIAELKDARARGVEVEVLLNPSKIGLRPLNEQAAEELRRAGCQVKWFEPDPSSASTLHAKLGIFDGEEVILGSANWTYNGMSWNREANVDIIDSEVAGYYEEMFQADFGQGTEAPVYLPPRKAAA